MANYTATTDMTLEQAITNGSMVNGENLTINNGAIVTCLQSPSILMGEVIINDGKLFVDGKNIATGNVINFVGEYNEDINSNALGTLQVDGDWYSLGTTDGTDSQTFSLSSYWGGSLEDVVPAIWVETGRRIDFDGSDGTIPEIDDWVYKVSDPTILGRIVEVNVSGSFLVVKYLTGSLSDGDAIAVRKIVDNKGPDLQIIWTADVNNISGDIKESGVYQEFGNARAGGTNYLSYMGHGIGGFAFDNQFQSNTITMGTSTGTNGGFVPPSGCDVKVPNVNFSCSNTTAFAAGNTAHAGSTYYQWYELEATNGGIIDLNICNIGTANFACEGASEFIASYVGSSLHFGSSDTFANVEFYNCVVASDPVSTASGYDYSFMMFNLIGSCLASDCLILKSADTRNKLSVNNVNDGLIKNCIVSWGGANAAGNELYLYEMISSSNITIHNCVGIAPDTETAELISFSNASDILVTDFIGSTTQDYSTTPTTTRFFYAKPGTKDINITGVNILGSGWTSSYPLLYLYNASDVKLRCIGMIDDKIDLNQTCNAVVGTFRYSKNIDLSRIWFTNSALFGEYPYHFYSPSLMNNFLTINNCSGDYESRYNLLGKDGFLFRGLHSGGGPPGGLGGIEDSLSGAYGRQIHDGFKSDTAGFISCSFIAPSDSIDNTTVLAGNPKFQKNGLLNMVSGDQLEIEQDFFSLGHTAFTGIYTSLITSGSWGADEWSNVSTDFQYDIGAGWNGSWLAAETAVNWTSITGTHQFDYNNETGGPFTLGEDLSWGTGGTAGTGILSIIIDNGATGTIDFILTSGVLPTDTLTVTGTSSSATADVSGSVTENSSIVDGVKLKYRFTATGTQTSMSMFLIDTTTTLQDQIDNFHPIDQNYVSVRVTAKNASTLVVIEDARVYLLADAGGPLTEGTVILNDLTNASGYLEDLEFLYSSDQPVIGWIRQGTSSPYFKSTNIAGTITSSGLSLTGFMIPDGA